SELWSIAIEFFCQAEDGIRDRNVTGVQTCALPICCNGKKGQDLVIRVPRGTIIRECEGGVVMADMSSDEPFIAAKGGKGGWGNQIGRASCRERVGAYGQCG